MVNELGNISNNSDFCTFADKIYFDFSKDKDLMIDDVISYLEGIREISKKLPFALEKICKAGNINITKIRLVDIKMEGLQHGSLESDLKFLFELTFPEKERKVIKEKWEAVNKNMRIAVVIGALVALYAAYSLGGCNSSSKLPSFSNKGNNVQIINNLGTMLAIPPEDLTSVFDDITKKPTAQEVNAALKIMRPAKKNGGNIRLSSKDSVTSAMIKQDFIEQTPESYIKPKQQIHTETWKNIEIQVRALDIDNPGKGWYAIIPAILPEHRLKLELSPEIDIMKLSALNVNGDVEVTYTITSDGSKKAQKALLLELK